MPPIACSPLPPAIAASRRRPRASSSGSLEQVGCPNTFPTTSFHPHSSFEGQGTQRGSAWISLRIPLHHRPPLPRPGSSSHSRPPLPQPGSSSHSRPPVTDWMGLTSIRRLPLTSQTLDPIMIISSHRQTMTMKQIMWLGSQQPQSEVVDMNKRYGTFSSIFGMYYSETFMAKSKMREPEQSGHDWVMTTLNNPTACFNNFRMNRELFDKLHDLLVSSYGLRPTKKMETVEALAMFLWVCGAPQSVRQAEDRLQRSTETISGKFEEVLHSVFLLSADIIKPRDSEFMTVHPRLQGPRFSPHFDNCIGVIDGTHIRVVVPASKVLQHVGRHGYPSQNVLAICDFDMRFTFAVDGWPGSVHDMRMFNDAIRKYGDKFPHPLPGYPNRAGYLAPYEGTKYHLPEFRQGPRPRGKKEVFNYVHSSLRNVIERSFGVLKMKWRILLDLPSYPMAKQTKIILACMALHNFIRESAMVDSDFDMCDRDENYMPIPVSSSSQHSGPSSNVGDEGQDMNVFRDSLANVMFAMQD